MRLLLVGSTAPWAIEHHYIRYLSQTGIELEVFSPSGYIARTVFNRLLLRMGSTGPYKAANEMLLRTADRFRPDIIWIFKGLEFSPDTLMSLKQRNIKLVNYNPDHPFIRTSVSHGGKNIEDCVPLYDLHFCYSRELAKKIEKEYGIATRWLPFGFELDDTTFERISKPEEIRRIGFVGNPDRLRARIIRQLAERGLEVDVFGHHWQKSVSKHPNIRVFDAVYGDKFWETIRRYRVQLNIFRPHNAGSHNMRTFEIPAAGGIMLAPDSPEHQYFFKDGEEAFLYRSEKEMEQYCRDLLVMEDVGKIRQQARQRSKMENYSYEKRAHFVLNQILSILETQHEKRSANPTKILR